MEKDQGVWGRCVCVERGRGLETNDGLHLRAKFKWSTEKRCFLHGVMPSCQSLLHVFCENTCFRYSTIILCTLRTFLPARVSNVALFWPVSFSAQVLVICSSAGLPHGGVCRFQGCNVKAWSGSLDTTFSVDEASVKEAVVAHVSFLCLQCSRFVPVRGSWRVPTCAHS